MSVIDEENERLDKLITQHLEQAEYWKDQYELHKKKGHRTLAIEAQMSMEANSELAIQYRSEKVTSNKTPFHLDRPIDLKPVEPEVVSVPTPKVESSSTKTTTVQVKASAKKKSKAKKK